MINVMERLDNNAMFYKDITQWLRNKTFTGLFFGLLIIAEIISLVVILNSDAMGQPGVYMYYALCFVLVGYGLVVSSMAHNLTKAEYQSGTFDLYILCGMTEKEMVRGKLYTMLYEFGFGFFCLVPFMFFAYILGGLDFLDMLIGCLLIWVCMLPVFMLRLCGAFFHRRPSRSAFWLIARVFLWYIVIFRVIFPTLFFVPKWVELIKESMTGNIVSISKLFTIALCYLGANWLFVFICSERIRLSGKLERVSAE